MEKELVILQSHHGAEEHIVDFPVFTQLWAGGDIGFAIHDLARGRALVGESGAGYLQPRNLYFQVYYVSYGNIIPWLAHSIDVFL